MFQQVLDLSVCKEWEPGKAARESKFLTLPWTELAIWTTDIGKRQSIYIYIYKD